MNDVYDTAAYIALIQHNFPQLEVQRTKPITTGWDSFVLEINNDLIFRFPMRPDVEAQIKQEIRLLPLLEQELSTPIPHFSYIGRGQKAYPHLFVGYQKLEGRELDDPYISQEQLATLVPALATFLSELHNISLDRAMEVGMKYKPWRDEYLQRYNKLQERVFPLLETRLRIGSQRLWEDFLHNDAFFTFMPRLIHRDLSAEHILTFPESGSLAGIIDWGDATIGDPAFDFVGLHHSRGLAFTQRVLERYQGRVDETFWQRLQFYLCYQPFSELFYGTLGNPQFIEKGLAGLHKLFPL